MIVLPPTSPKKYSANYASVGRLVPLHGQHLRHVVARGSSRLSNPTSQARRSLRLQASSSARALRGPLQALQRTDEASARLSRIDGSATARTRRNGGITPASQDQPRDPVRRSSSLPHSR